MEKVYLSNLTVYNKLLFQSHQYYKPMRLYRLNQIPSVVFMIRTLLSAHLLANSVSKASAMYAQYIRCVTSAFLLILDKIY